MRPNRHVSLAVIVGLGVAGCHGAAAVRHAPDASEDDTPTDEGPRDAAPPPDLRPHDARVADAVMIADAAVPADRAVIVDAAPVDVAVGAPGPWARGITISLVEVAQAVFIKVGDAKAVVAADQRNSQLIEGRAAFLRVHVTTPPGFTARALRGVLTIHTDTDQAFEDRKMIAGPSTPDQLTSTFNFLLPPAAVQAGATLVASVYEAGAAIGPEPTTPPRFPAKDAADLGVAAGPMLMAVVLVPVRGPSGPLDDSAPRRKHLDSYLGDVYPAQTMNITWHAPLTIDAPIDSATAFKMLQTTRTTDKAPAGAYYHMIIAAEDATDKYLGLGVKAGPLPTDAPNRIAMTMVTDHQVDSQWDTVAHEMGHNLGRDHAPGCMATGTDPMFPYANTGVGVDGYSIPEAAWKSHTKWKDVMGYCYPTWISDYTWNAFAARIRITTDFSSPTSPFLTTRAPGPRSVQGFVIGAHPPRWGLVEGPLAGAQPLTPTRFADVVGADGRRTRVAVNVDLLHSPAGPEPAARMITFDLPDGPVDRIDVSADGARWTISATDLQ